MSTMPRYAVTITFADDAPYTGHEEADSSTHAFYLALVKSRAKIPAGSFHAPVVRWDAVLVDMEKV